MISYRYSDKEMKEILKDFTIVVDTREKNNQHILDYFRLTKKPFIIRALKTGDYSAMIPADETKAIFRDIYLDVIIERKNSIDEITGNLLKNRRSAFVNELIRASQKSFCLLCEDADGYGKILRGEYRSNYDEKALLGTLKTFENRYNFPIIYLDKEYSGNYIYFHLYYAALEMLKNGKL